eukprot:TRINITY_DN2294_c0_g1_i1.p1 TRINITY_DN2294_c0_g1~~TRINITY_DN2294_c0_g1_i1.p1  ORF type:complete len:500 (+),score=136.96 TRINITY_DN2294_c0_g1_i1:87-1586(+)
MAQIEEDDRVVKDLPAPPRHPFPRDKLFCPGTGLPDLEALKEHLSREGRLHIPDAVDLIHRATELLRTEPNLLTLGDPITVCGDVHGQFFDLLRLFEVGGPPETTQYLFLGDYVDRGCFSTECVFYLYALKITYPKRFFMLRGNHECRQLTQFFNFKDECKFKYNLDLYDEIMLSFDALPLAALINDKFLCIHGGLSPEVKNLNDIQAIDRFMEIPRSGPMCDLLWSDPVPDDGDSSAVHEDEEDSDSDGERPRPQVVTRQFSYNFTRQCSYVYGVEAVEEFLEANNLTSLIRAHEAQLEGYKMQMINAKSGIPRVITIFSAPNYCDVYKNKAACLEFDNNLLNIRQFVCSPHPYFLPNFMDVFEWSLPFVAEKVTDMLANVLSYNAEQDSDDDEEQKTPVTPVTVLQRRGNTLKQKVLAVSKMARVYRILRQENDNCLQLKQLTPNHKLPFGLLREGKDAIRKVLTSFEEARRADRINEKRPRDGPKRKNANDKKKPA